MLTNPNFLVYLSTILGLLVAVEQVLAGVPALKSNSTFQLICNITNATVELGKKILGSKSTN